jgi:RNA polymerase sigma-70 factor (ECF subfamily)
MIGAVRDGGQAHFWAGLGTARRQQLDAAPGWEARLAVALEEPRRVWAVDWLERAEFGAELARRLEDDDLTVESWWDHLRPAELYLACACARGVAAAIQRFEKLYGDEIARTARRFERPGLATDDLIQLLRAKLFAGPAEAAPGESQAGRAKPAGRPKIASYSGQGFLQNWVRVTTTRTFIDCRRWQADAPEIPITQGLLEILPESGADPELQLLKREHAAHFKAAFAEAVAALDASDRLMLRQHLVDKLTIDQIGALYHLHRATAARRLARARQVLLDGARARLARRLGLAPERLAAALELIASRLDASVERVLR